ncbi:GAP family protein [Streptomyces sp. NPDC001219]
MPECTGHRALAVSLPAILLLFTPRARATSGGFLAGWTGGIAVVASVLAMLAVLATSIEVREKTATWASWTKVGLAAILLLLASRRATVALRREEGDSGLDTVADGRHTAQGPAPGPGAFAGQPEGLLAVGGGRADDRLRRSGSAPRGSWTPSATPRGARNAGERLVEGQLLPQEAPARGTPCVGVHTGERRRVGGFLERNEGLAVGPSSRGRPRPTPGVMATPSAWPAPASSGRTGHAAAGAGF